MKQNIRVYRVVVALIIARYGKIPAPLLGGECARCLIGSTVWRSHSMGRGRIASLYNWAVRRAPVEANNFLAFVITPIHACPNTRTVEKHW